ncbi:Diadenosine polyphosphate hydrolase and related proteins of the histidine triad (HIT) family [Handroanthus impetiginosus]|uniref:Bis(5'-adenosyl)-triphosphatase n=1 Tax=Handroanthus impetiginosus TaxID=429701 RepID=A0A2G9I727_9LAMI|nr:Diadenosine polyphosphate hydrolase and related proteins of the histidine triad (HIT) family [Handroanthus impetiginosus]
MLKQLPLLSSRYSLTPFLYLHSSTRHRFRRQPSLSLSPGRAFSSFDHNPPKAQMESESYSFGPYTISSKEVFYTTQLSFAFVNLRPVVPGVRDVKRFSDLTADETSDLWLTAQKIGRQLESYHKASSLTLTIQDGPQAGQSVAHVHVHILPRKSSDFEKNDDIYDAIDLKEKELKQKLDLDIDRKDRTIEEMAEEANEYRKLFV